MPEFIIVLWIAIILVSMGAIDIHHSKRMH